MFIYCYNHKKKFCLWDFSKFVKKIIFVIYYRLVILYFFLSINVDLFNELYYVKILKFLTNFSKLGLYKLISFILLNLHFNNLDGNNNFIFVIIDSNFYKFACLSFWFYIILFGYFILYKICWAFDTHFFK